MRFRSSLWTRSLALAATLALCSTVGLLAAAEQAAPTEEKSQSQLTAADFPQTPEERMKRFDLAEDPGLDPDPAKVFMRYGKKYQIHRYERRWAKMDIGRPGWIRPFGPANVERELYRADEKSVWTFHEVAEPVPAPTPDRIDEMGEVIQNQQYMEESLAYFRKMQPEFALLQPPPAGVKLQFELSSEGLPASGSWRNSFDVADMNGDGHLDIIAPPQRGPGGVPAIFLGDGKGKWSRWTGVKFGKALNYGSVVAGDLNKDGHQDVVVGAHLSSIFVFLGDGKGNFKESSEGLPERFGTRRVVLSDVDRDGDLDIVAISEGPMMQPRDGEMPALDSKLKAFLNEAKATRWKLVNVADENRLLGGDFVSTGDFNGDKYPDFIGASIYFDGPDTLYLSNGKKGWNPVGRGEVIPFMSLYGATAAGKFSSKKVDDAFLSYSRAWPASLDPALVPPPETKMIVGIDRLSFKGNTATRTPVVRYGAENRIWGMATGDFNGDGQLDLVYTTKQPRQFQILLGNGKGGFSQAEVMAEGILENGNYDLRADDVNRDGLADLLIIYESNESLATRGKNGAIQVFLNRGRAAS